MVWVQNIANRFICLNTLSAADASVWKAMEALGDRTKMEGSGHWVQALWICCWVWSSAPSLYFLLHWAVKMPLPQSWTSAGPPTPMDCSPQTVWQNKPSPPSYCFLTDTWYWWWERYVTQDFLRGNCMKELWFSWKRLLPLETETLENLSQFHWSVFLFSSL